MKKLWWIVLVVVVLVVLYGFGAYNGLVKSREAVDNQWAQVATQYQRRLDLIPNLVESVKGAMAQEQTVFDDLAKARERYAGVKSVNDKAEAATMVESAFGRLLAIMENYPELKSIDTVQTLMSQLEGTENRVSVERKRFNDQVQAYNVMVKTVPTSIVAGIFGFDNREYFEAAQGAENAPQVQF
jgi:LemA protein